MPVGLTHSNLDGSISDEDIAINFTDLHCSFGYQQANAEASRCLYCYDAPCINACPTSIDIPTFIHQITTDNLVSSAKTILSENIMGGTCARACPTEILCEQACVLNSSQQNPVNIGLLQRFAVDQLINSSLSQKKHPFNRAESSGKKIAIIGAGPAGLSCAHRAALLGHEVTIFEAKDKPGGLNEYGLAAYKMVDNFAQKEIEFLLQVGGISVEYNKFLDKDVFLSELQETFDAVFVSIGLSDSNALGISGETLECVVDACQFIEEIRQTEDKSSINIGNDVVVIGAGNTAIDAAIQSKRLGAKNVTLVYRRGERNMSATDWEVDLARKNGIQMLFWAAPMSIVSKGKYSSIEFAKTKINGEELHVTEERFYLETDLLLVAIGQKLDQSFSKTSTSNNAFQIVKNKIEIAANYKTSLDGVFAGGDCVDSGEDLTVQAVQDGKMAAHEIDVFLKQGSSSKPSSKPDLKEEV